MSQQYRFPLLNRMDIANAIARLRVRLQMELPEPLFSVDLNAAFLIDEICTALELNEAEKLIALGVENAEQLEIDLVPIGLTPEELLL